MPMDEQITMSRRDLMKVGQDNRLRVQSLVFLAQSALKALIDSNPFPEKNADQLAVMAAQMAKTSYKELLK